MSRSKITAALVSVIALSAATVALAAPKSPTITVTDGTGLSSTSLTSGFSSHFTASGCGFRANDQNYYLVILGPGLYTSQLTTWVDRFSVGSDGCGTGSPSWSGSGLTGTFDVYVARSASGNPSSAQPSSNIVSIYISSP
jgi:hypothetical protein